jgi:emopamil binding protein
MPAMRRSVPLSQRRLDWILLAFFALNLFFITYIVDIEQLTIANPFHFQYPLWPPRFFVDMVHSYGSKYDPLLMARPAFWRMGIWIDVIWNGPFYVFAIYAIVRGRDWIRVPALVWCGSMSAVVLMILSEEYNGIHRAPHFGFVLALNLPWLLLPLGTLARMARAHPFTELVPGLAAPVTQAESAAEGLAPASKETAIPVPLAIQETQPNPASDQARAERAPQ